MVQMPQPSSHHHRRRRPSTRSNGNSPSHLYELFLDLPHPSSALSNEQPSRHQQRRRHHHRQQEHSSFTHAINSNVINYSVGGAAKAKAEADKSCSSIGFNTATTIQSSSNNCDDGIARIIDPPPPPVVHGRMRSSSSSSSQLSNHLYNPATIARITSLAFPEYEETPPQQQQQQIENDDDYRGHRLSKFDIYQSDFIPHHHSFTIVVATQGSSSSSSYSYTTTHSSSYAAAAAAAASLDNAGGGAGIKVFGHVRQYLPPASSSSSTTSRIDVGRRSHRAMVLLTRASGGTEFYAAVLRAAEILAAQSRISRETTKDDDHHPVRSYLHALFRNHAALIARYEELRRYGLGLNFVDPPLPRGGGDDGGGGGNNTQHHHQQNQPQSPTENEQQHQQQQTQQSPSSSDNATSSLTPCEAARLIMKENEFLFRIALDGVEFGGIGDGGGGCGGDCHGSGISNSLGLGNKSSWKRSAFASSDLHGGKRPSKFCIAEKKNTIIDQEKNINTTSSVRKIVENKDRLQFYLPHSLQPGYDALPSGFIPDDIAHPILPLLRCIKSKNFVRLLSALLCEVRIIFVSACATRLSSCVRAASSILAQGLLAWEHACIPVLPPSMMKSVLCCAENESPPPPYLVGILNDQAPRVRQLLGKSVLDVLYIQLDTNEVMTLNMANPRWTVPDLLKKVGGNTLGDGGGGGGGSQKSASECLVHDLDEILKAEQVLSGQEIVNGMSSDNIKDSKVKKTEKSIPLAVSSSEDSDQRKMSRRKSISLATPVRHMSLLERREYASSVDAAAAFGKLIRSSFVVKAAEDNVDDALEDEIDQKDQAQRRFPRDAPMYSSMTNLEDIERFVASSHVSEYEHGEECIRSALTTFFVHMYGDMGMYLSESRGSFLLDRRKFLLRKEQLGAREGSPTHLVLQRLSTSRMFAAHARRRVEDMSMVVRDRSNIMPHHIPLFDVCSKFLTVHQLEFSLDNVRRIVSTTVGACTRHMAVERHDEVRSRALALMRENALGGDGANMSPTLAMSDLLNSCREYDTNLRAVMGVIWNRLHRSKNSGHVLSALKLLTKLVSEGPLTAIAEALDGIRIIDALKCFSDGKNGDASREVGVVASHLNALLVDLPTLFAVRRHIAVAKAEEVIPTQQLSWSNYIVSRLPLRVNSRALHALLRPPGLNVQRRILYDDNDSYHAVNAASSDDDASSIAALSRLRGEKGFQLYQDREDVDLDWMNHHFAELSKGEGITAKDLFPD